MYENIIERGFVLNADIMINNDLQVKKKNDKMHILRLAMVNVQINIRFRA